MPSWAASDVYKRLVILGFGEQPHPVVKTATIQSNGVRIRTSKETNARVIFDGLVYSIIISKNNTIILTATMTVNENQLYNDDVYEYDSVGIPFFSTLSKEILNLLLSGNYE